LGPEEYASKRFGLYFAAGNIFLREVFDLLLAQSYFKPGIIKVMEELLNCYVTHIPIRSFYNELLLLEQDMKQQAAGGFHHFATPSGDDEEEETGKKKPNFASLVTFMLRKKVCH
jgi:hypothetical protein